MKSYPLLRVKQRKMPGRKSDFHRPGRRRTDVIQGVDMQFMRTLAAVAAMISVLSFSGILSAQSGGFDSNLRRLFENPENNGQLPVELLNAPIRNVTPPADWQPQNFSSEPSGIVTYSIKTGNITYRDAFPLAENITSAKANPGILGRGIQNKVVIGSDDRTKITDTTQWPYRAVVHLYLEVEGGYAGCSGALIGEHHVLTAGHCVFNDYEWVKDVIVLPGAYGTTGMPYGMIGSEEIHIYSQWQNDNENYDYDMAVISLDKPIGKVTGFFGYANDNNLYGRYLHLTGYPGDLDDGMNMYHAQGQIVDVSNYSIMHYIDTYQGTSGSSIYDLSGSDPISKAVNSWGAEGGGWSGAVNGGPRITTQRVSDINGYKDSDPVPADKADLVDQKTADREMSSTKIRPGEHFSVSSTIENIGTSKASSFKVGWYVSANKYFDNKDLLIGDEDVSEIEPYSGDMEVSWAGQFPDTIPDGEYYVLAVLDPDSSVSEFSETNNTGVFSKQLEVSNNDIDSDGIENIFDGCPEEAEDFDDIQDSDGCPEEDADDDGIKDEKDECPEEVEDADDFEDDDGCPEEGGGEGEG